MRARARWGVAVVAAAYVAFGTAPGAVAQALPRLHITALGMHADRASVAAGDIYHITIHVHVTERRDRLDELQLPGLTNATDLGDERRRVAAPGGGTDFYEIMTVSSPDPGTASFTPAYIDAIDPATGRGMRYSSQPLSIRITGAAPLDQTVPAAGHAIDDAVRFAVVVIAGVALLILIVLRLPRRARAPRPAAAVPAAPAIVPSAPPGDALRDAIVAFRARGDDPSLDALRNVLFVRAGARPGATLTDALGALGSRNPALARAMAIAERVRFGPQTARATATADLFDALDVLLCEPVTAG
jgi:hypothetical protein